MSSSSSFISIISLLICSLILQKATSTDPLYSICFSQENYTSNSPYSTNLNDLLDVLSSQTPPTGYGQGSVGQGSDRVNGLALCRGDVKSLDCKSCVTEARKEILNRCPYYKGAIIWYDYCLLKYSNVKFFGQIDNSNKFYLYNVQSVNDPATFNENVKELLTSLTNKAYVSSMLFSTGEAKLGNSVTLYGLVQCTRDLSSSDCKKCLDGAIGELPNCCDGKEGGRVVGGSCNFRYEIYPFVIA
ncbi:Gnk2-homologous domain [Dillenia turbinata]|uniref:Gnk2-homologous domain n=1 Tax=Dillenia turbinata TaxID=194707 RepID=A0AAN8UM50_9MAGN